MTFSLVDREHGSVGADVLSGLTVALALVPEAVAFAFVAGISPVVGLYGAFMMGLITSLFGGRPGMISGATGAMAVVMVSLVREGEAMGAGQGLQLLFATLVLAGLGIGKTSCLFATTAKYVSDNQRPAGEKTALTGRSPYPSLEASPQAPHMPDRSLRKHVNEVNARAIDLSEIAQREYGLEHDFDVALATAILHDVDKPMIYRWDGSTFSYADGRSLKDHGAIGAELCLEHGIPLEVAEMVRHHSAFASEGLPGTVEGTIVHYADFVSNDFAAILSGVETIHASTRPVPRAR